MAAAASLHHHSPVAPPSFVVGGGLGSQTGLEWLLLCGVVAAAIKKPKEKTLWLIYLQ